MNKKYTTPLIVLFSELMMIWAHAEGSSVWWLVIITALNTLNIVVWLAMNAKE